MTGTEVSAIVGAALWLADLAIKVIALGVIPRNRRPSTGMAWLLLILIIPFVGFLIFLLIGRTTPGRKRHEQQAEINAQVHEAVRTGGAGVVADLGPTYLGSVARLNTTLGGLPLLRGNRVELQTEYAEQIATLAEAVRGAQKFVHVEFYISAWDDVTAPVFDAMADAVKRGVRVRMLYDHLGARGIPGYKEFLPRLDAAGIQHHAMLPIRPFKGEFRRPDLRNHRKILVVDNVVAVTGSLNLIEPGYNKPKNHAAGRKWVELTARVEGPLVTALNALFATDWYKETGEFLTDGLGSPAAPVEGGLNGQVIASGPGFATENNLRAFATLIYSAQRRLSVTSPYFVPDESLLYALTTTAQRGVDVELFVSAEGDQFMVYHAQRSYYEALLRAGVRIYLYPAPYVLHSKFFSVDDDVAVMGSSNMDMRSFALNYEVSLMLLGPDIVGRIREVEDRYRSLSAELKLEEWLARGRRQEYIDNVMRLTAALQ